MAAGASLIGGGVGAGAAKKTAKANEKVLRFTTKRQIQQLGRQREDVLGRQRAGFAAGGVRVGRGTSRLLEVRTREEFARSEEAIAFLYRQQQRGAQAQTQGVQTASILGGFGGAASAGLDFFAATGGGSGKKNGKNGKD